FDVGALHKGKKNGYMFQWWDKKIVLLPFMTKPLVSPKPTLLTVSGSKFRATIKTSDVVPAFIAKEQQPHALPFLPEVVPLLEEFSDLAPAYLLDELPPLRDV
ncbi:hypothetical protein PanWU01x14_048110, partial [Parasponia andersonii]